MTARRADYPSDLRAIAEALELLFGPGVGDIRIEQAGVVANALELAALRGRVRRRGDDIPSVSAYAHWNEDAERVWYEENRYDMEHADEPLEDDDRDARADAYSEELNERLEALHAVEHETPDPDCEHCQDADR